MLLLSPTSLCMLFEENLNNITRVSPVNAPGNAPDVSAPGIRVKPVVHAKILITIHQPAQSTSFRNRSHCSTPTLPPSTGPVNKVMVGIKRMVSESLSAAWIGRPLLLCPDPTTKCSLQPRFWHRGLLNNGIRPRWLRS